MRTICVSSFLPIASGPFCKTYRNVCVSLAFFSGLLIDISKCGIVIKGPLHALDQALVEETRTGELFLGIAVCLHIKYVVVVMGDVNTAEAFSFPLAEAQRRVSRLASYHLALKEEEKMRILSTVLLTSKAYFPTDITIKALKMICNMALGGASWGVTLDQLARNRSWEDTRSPHPRSGSMHSMVQLVIPCHSFLKDERFFSPSQWTTFGLGVLAMG